MADVVEINVAVGTRIEREFTSAELAQRSMDAADEIARAQIAKNKEAAVTSARTKLAALGLTDDEIKALVG